MTTNFDPTNIQKPVPIERTKRRQEEALYQNRVKKLRVALEMSTKELALKAGVSYDILYRIEEHETLNPQPRVMSRIAEALNIWPPCDIYIMDPEDREIAHKAWLELEEAGKVQRPSKRLQNSTSQEQQKSDRRKKPHVVNTDEAEPGMVDAPQGVKISFPNRLTNDTIIEAIQLAARELTKLEGEASFDGVNYLVNKWLSQMEANPEDYEYKDQILSQASQTDDIESEYDEE